MRAMWKSNDSWRIRLYRKGLKDNQIAKRVGVSPKTICDWRKRKGLPRNTEPGGQIKEFPEREKLYKEGLNDGEIARELGKSSNTIHSWRERRGFLPNVNPGGQPYQISLIPTKELGYFCGLVIGDGSLYFSKRTRNYNICLESTKKEIVEIFCKSAKKLGLNPLGIYTREKTRKFPDGSIRTDLTKAALVSSKILYDALKPYKQNDFKWEIPKFLTTEESLFGFVGGIFDAEGNIAENGIAISSKHDENLINLKRVFKKLGFIYGKILVKNGKLLMYGLGNIRLLIEKVGLRLKKEKVNFLLQNRPRYHPREEYEEVMNLRKEKGLGGLRISKITGIPISTVEDWIYGRKKPWELKITKTK